MGMVGFWSAAGVDSTRLATAIAANKPTSLGQLENDLSILAEGTELRDLLAA
jgi:hypothetical protein